MSNTRKIALTGILCALGVVFMLMGGVIPLATFCCPVIAGLVLIPIFVECGEGTAWAGWFIIAVLSVLLSPEKESAMLFLFIGYYPVLRWRLEQIRSGVLRVGAKLAVFNAAVVTMYALCIFLFKMDAIVKDFRELGIIMALVTLLLGNVVLILYDRILKVMTFVYVNKLRKKLLK